MSLLSLFISNVLMSGYSKPNYGKWVATLMAFLSLSTGLVVGCVGLYHYALPQWGKAITLLGIGCMCLITGSIIFAFRYFLKPKPSSWRGGVSALESNLMGVVKQLVNGEETLKLLRPYVSLKSLSALFLVATVLGFYLSGSKKE